MALQFVWCCSPFVPWCWLRQTPRGHCLCLYGFGASGMPFRGEASKQLWKTVDSQSSGSRRSVTLATSLPLVRENLTRRFEIVDGESVVYVDSELESPLGFDRPVSWAEHATLGPPFLEKGKVAVDMPGLQCRVRAEKLMDPKRCRWPS